MRLSNPFTGLTEAQHTRGADGRNSDGIACNPESREAVSWCAQGVLWRSGYSDRELRELEGFPSYLWIKWGKSITELNDVGLSPFSFFENEFDAWQEESQS